MTARIGGVIAACLAGCALAWAFGMCLEHVREVGRELAPRIVDRRETDAEVGATLVPDILSVPSYDLVGSSTASVETCTRCGTTLERGQFSGAIEVRNARGVVFFDGCIACLESAVNAR